MIRGVLLAIAGMSAVVAQRPELVVGFGSGHELPGAPARAKAVTYARSGAKYSLTYPDNLVYRHEIGARTVTLIPFHPKGLAPGDVDVLADISIDPIGRVFVPMFWRTKEARFNAGVAKLEPSGSASLIVLDPPVGVRHVAVDERGELFVLGVDGSFFRNATDECNLIHQYSPDGVRLRSFSSCPATNAPGQSPSRRKGVDFEDLRTDVDQGEIWVARDTLYHLLAASGELRVFSTDGQLKAEVVLERPERDGLPGTFIRRILPLPGGNWLAVWLHSRRVQGGTRGFTTLALHGRGGELLANPVIGASLGASPAFVDAQGRCMFLEPIGPSGGPEVFRPAQFRFR